ncbi:MAG: NUDIX domain-containing protein [Bacteroidales bacterium]
MGQHILDLFQYCPKCGKKAFDSVNEKAKRCQLCGYTYYMNPSAAVAVFILNPEKTALLVATRAKEPAKGTFDLPGGFTDLNETVEEAVVREVFEETNLNVSKLNYMFSIPNSYEYSGLIVPTMDLFFEVEVDNLTDLIPADDVAECEFIDLDKIDPVKFGLKSVSKAVSRYIKEHLNELSR